MARAVWYIAVKCLSVCWTNFFDDFLAYTSSELAFSTQATIDLLFRLLGWKVAEDKGVPFASSLACLGVKIDLEHFAFGCVTISNTPERKRELAETVRKVLQDGKLSLTSAQSLRGRMQFAENQFMGRMARRARAAVTEHSVLGRLDVSCSWRCHLEDFLGELLEGPSRTLKTFTRDTLFLFTDACFEPDRSDPVGIGCVLVGTDGRPLEFIAGSPQPSAFGLRISGSRRKKNHYF